MRGTRVSRDMPMIRSRCRAAPCGDEWRACRLELRRQLILCRAAVLIRSPGHVRPLGLAYQSVPSTIVSRSIDICVLCVRQRDCVGRPCLCRTLWQPDPCLTATLLGLRECMGGHNAAAAFALMLQSLHCLRNTGYRHVAMLSTWACFSVRLVC